MRLFLNITRCGWANNLLELTLILPVLGLLAPFLGYLVFPLNISVDWNLLQKLQFRGRRSTGLVLGLTHFVNRILLGLVLIDLVGQFLLTIKLVARLHRRLLGVIKDAIQTKQRLLFHPQPLCLLCSLYRGPYLWFDRVGHHNLRLLSRIFGLNAYQLVEVVLCFTDLSFMFRFLLVCFHHFNVADLVVSEFRHLVLQVNFLLRGLLLVLQMTL